MDQSIEHELTSLGLSAKEARVYLALLPLGRAPASILARRTGIGRSMAQYLCKQLVQRGLLRPTQEGATIYYVAETPDVLVAQATRTRDDAALQVERAHRLTGPLKSLLSPLTKLPRVRYYEGVDGIIELYEHVLASGQPNCIFSVYVEHFDPRLKTYMEERYLPARVKAGLPSWIIYNDLPLTHEFAALDAELHRVSMFLPRDDYPFESACHIYGENVAFLSLHPSDMTGVRIENARIAELQRTAFRLAWETARRLPVNRRNREHQLPLLLVRST